MLLAIDIGNSNISVGLFDKAGKLLFLSSIDTDSRKTADQISIDLMNLFALYRYDLKDVTGAIFSSVVPALTPRLREALHKMCECQIMEVGRATHGGGPRCQDRVEYPHGGPQPTGGRSGGQRRSGAGEVRSAHHYDRHGDGHHHLLYLRQAQL